MNKIIDLRSDTFTLPDKGMRQAIYEAEVGNADYGEDPSVNRLEEQVAEYFEREAGVFLPSATMAGQIAVRVWSQPGDIVIIEEYGHNFYFETGAMSAIAGVQAHLLKGRRGLLSVEDIEVKVKEIEGLSARTALVILENTSNFGGGTIYPLDLLTRIFTSTEKCNLPVHIDGARIWNAIVATRARPVDLVQSGGSISVCFSKGLGAPMGALLLGDSDFIKEARRIQLMLGGVMRQVGFMAAAAQYGFANNMERLAEDHANAALIAQRLVSNPELEINTDDVETNILYFKVKGGKDHAAQLVKELAEFGVQVCALDSLVRLVTSLNVSRQECEQAAKIINELLN